MQSRTGNVGPMSLLLSMLASFVVMATLAFGCSPPRRSALTARDIAEHGTATLEASPERVFQACVLALQMAGYAIEVAEPATGLVVTRPRRMVEAEAAGTDRLRFRGYVLEVERLGATRARVTATPSAWDGRDAPPGATSPEWDLDHERASWERLFADVHSLVDRGRGD